MKEEEEEEEEKKKMEAPSTTSDFEEDEAEIAERGARAWHFFEGGLHFSSSSHSHTTREREQSL